MTSRTNSCFSSTGSASNSESSFAVAVLMRNISELWRGCQPRSSSLSVTVNLRTCRYYESFAFGIETRSLPTLTRSYPRRFTLITRTARVLAPATLAALPSTRAIPDRDVFYVADPISSIAWSVVATDRRRRQCRGLSRGARLRPPRAAGASIEIFPAARARGVTIPGLRRCCME